MTHEAFELRRGLTQQASPAQLLAPHYVIDRVGVAAATVESSRLGIMEAVPPGRKSAQH